MYQNQNLRTRELTRPDEHITTMSSPQSFLSILEANCYAKLEKEREQKTEDSKAHAFKEEATWGFAKNMVAIVKEELLQIPLEDIRKKNGSVEIGHDRDAWENILKETTFNYQGIYYHYNPNHSKFPHITSIISLAAKLAKNEGINYKVLDGEGWVSDRYIFYVQLPNFPFE